jgi:hypothetical protein
MCFDIDFPRLNDESIEDSNQSGFDEPLLDSGSKFNRTVGIIVLGFIAAFVLFVVVKTVTLLVRKRNRARTSVMLFQAFFEFSCPIILMNLASVSVKLNF